MFQQVSNSIPSISSSSILQVSNYLKYEAPRDILITSMRGEIQPAGEAAQLFATVCSALFWIGLFLVFAGEPILNAINAPAPARRFLDLLKSNTMLTVSVLFMMNWMGGQALSTGAFEVFYNGKQVWSKMETGVLPEPEYLLRVLKQLE